jgi:aryl-alcohol dehydrogenase-like predicted oxidoreductase
MTISRREFIATSAASLLVCSGKLSAHNSRSAHMLSKQIPSSGEQLPVIGLGTLQAFDVAGTPEERAALGEVLKLLADQGGTLIDTSPRYGRAEAVVGDLCAELNLTDDLFFATKVFSEGEQAGIDEMNTSLERLHTPVLDLMQVHSMRDWEIHLPSIRKLREEGKVRYIGITIHRDTGHEQMMKLMREENLDFIQVNYNLVERGAAKEVLPLAQELGVAVMINVPFAKAELFKKTSGLDLPDWASDFDCDSWAQFFLKYVISHPAVTCVIPRTGNPHHMADNLMAGFGRLPNQDTRLEMEAIIDRL